MRPLRWSPRACQCKIQEKPGCRSAFSWTPAWYVHEGGQAIVGHVEQGGDPK
jgi:hypothetical protein